MKHRVSVRLTALAAAMLHMPAVWAQGSEEEDLAMAYGDKSTVSIATGTVQSLRRAPAIASVITAEDIAATGATDIDEVLETVAGVHVSRSQVAYAPLYYFRGIGVGTGYNPEVLMLQNGVPMTSIYDGNRGDMWSTNGLPLENVARIEIIRGPGSALYGADAFAGVINVITKTAAEVGGTQIGARVGSFSTGNAWVLHGGTWGGLEVAAYLRIGSTDGWKEPVSRDARSRLDAATGTRFSLAPGPVNTGVDSVDGWLDLSQDKWRIRFGYRLRDNVETGAGVSAALDPRTKMKTERITADFSWFDPRFAQNWSLGFNGSFFHNEDDSPNGLMLQPAGVVIGGTTLRNGLIGGPSRSERTFRFSALAAYTGFENHHLRLGVGHDDMNLYRSGTKKNFYIDATGAAKLTGQAGNPMPGDPQNAVDYNTVQPHIQPHRRMLNYWFAQDEWNFARDWTLTAGLRRDSYSDFGHTTNPRLALVWDAALDLTLKFLHGRAFRAPSFAEKWGINPVANGNPSLRPETIATTEAAASWQARRDLKLDLSLFYYDMRNVIRTVSNTPGSTAATFQNAGDQTGRGYELEATWDMDRNWRLAGHYSFQHGVDKNTNTDPGYAPRHRIYGRLDWRFIGGWLASAQANRVTDRKRAVNDTREEVPDYTTVDLTVRTVQQKGKWNFAGSIRNLFNARVLEPSQTAAKLGTFPTSLVPEDLPMAGRSFYLQADYKM